MGWNWNPGNLTLGFKHYAALPCPVLEADVQALSLIFLLLVRSQEALAAGGGGFPLRSYSVNRGRDLRVWPELWASLGVPMGGGGRPDTVPSSQQRVHSWR